MKDTLGTGHHSATVTRVLWSVPQAPQESRISTPVSTSAFRFASSGIEETRETRTGRSLSSSSPKRRVMRVTLAAASQLTVLRPASEQVHARLSTPVSF
jgi:hypothetical protein